MTTLFDDQLRVRASDPDTSRDAAEAIRPVLGQECQRVLRAVKLLGGTATAYEVAGHLAAEGHHRDQNCIARRCTDLRDAGRLVDTGQRRPGRSGRALIVWAATS